MYLQRRLQKLADDLRSGSLSLSTKIDEAIKQELREVKFDDDGRVLLSSCGPGVRSLARSYHNISEYHRGERKDRGATGPINGATPSVDLQQLQDTLFEHYHRIYVAFTGCSPQEFTGLGEDFSSAIRRHGGKMKSWPQRRLYRHLQAVDDAVGELGSFYNSSLHQTFDAAMALPGNKLVFGGSQRFSQGSHHAVRQMALYADSILVPDPVLPWLEGDRREERFRHGLLLEQIHHLLPFRELAAVAGHPVVVFPSLEKTLERDDEVTQDGMELLVLSVMNEHLPGRFEDMAELIEFVVDRPDEFLSAVERNRLFIPPGGDGSESLAVGIQMLKSHDREWRSKEYLKRREGAPDALLVADHICDRLAPFFHLDENARCFAAQPLMSLPVHWHYFGVAQSANAARVSGDGANLSGAIETVRALSGEAHAWLGNVPIPALAELRERGENRTFRSRFEEELSGLAVAHEGDYDAEVRRITQALQQLLTEHEAEVQTIEDQYAKKYTGIAVGTGAALLGSWITFAAQFLPWFPDVGTFIEGMELAGGGLLYAKTKAEQAREIRQQRRTLIGYLAEAKSK